MFWCCFIYLLVDSIVWGVRLPFATDFITVVFVIGFEFCVGC